MKSLFTFLALFFVVINANAQKPSSRFEGVLNAADTKIDGTDKISSFQSGLTTLYMDTSIWGTWTGWSISSYTDVTDGTFLNQFSAKTGVGANGSGSYAVGYNEPKLSLDEAQTVTGMFITNSTYAHHVITNGNEFSKKFGGETGDDRDTFVVQATGYFEGKTTDVSHFYLADFRFPDNSKDYVISEWTWWDLSSLGLIDSVTFKLFSSDNGDFGSNTPAYFCMDNFHGTPPSTKVVLNDFESLTIPERGYYNGDDLRGGFYTSGAYFTNAYNPDWMSWSGFAFSNQTDVTTPGFENQYSVFAGSGVDESDQFVVAHATGNTVIELPYNKEGTLVKGTYLTNATYTALSMKNGDDFAKKFGGASGNDEDWYKVEFVGFDYSNKETGVVEFYLADYRFADNAEDYIVDTWEWIDLSTLGAVTRIEIRLSSSDANEFGINTPGYLCLDDFNSPKPVSTPETKAALATQLYPNPANQRVSVSGLDLDQDFAIEVFDLSGSLHVKELNNNTMDISGLANGTYLVKVTQNEDVSHHKLSKL